MIARWRSMVDGWLPSAAIPDRPSFGKLYPWRQVMFHNPAPAVDKARKIIDRAMSMGIEWRAGLSCGKDSTAMAFLLADMGIPLRGMSIKDDLDYPGELEYLRHIESRTFPVDVITPGRSLLGYLSETSSSLTDDLHSRTADLSKEWFYRLIDEYQESEKYGGVFLGLRAQESPGRAANAMFNGTIYQRSGGIHVAQPLASWTTLDVHAYLFRRGVPVLPVYLCVDPGSDPLRLRKSWWVCGGGTASYLGHYAWLKRWWPDLWFKAAVIDHRVTLLS